MEGVAFCVGIRSIFIFYQSFFIQEFLLVHESFVERASSCSEARERVRSGALAAASFSRHQSESSGSICIALDFCFAGFGDNFDVRCIDSN